MVLEALARARRGPLGALVVARGLAEERRSASRASRACCAAGPSAAALEPVEPMEVARRIVHESLPALGILDLGEDEDLPRDPEFDGDAPPVALRLTARGRALLADKAPPATRPRRSSSTRTCCGSARRRGSGAVLAVAPFVEVGRAAETLDLIVAPQTLARALSAGVEADVLRARIEALAPLPESLSRTARAGERRRRPRRRWQPAAGFLWVEDAQRPRDAPHAPRRRRSSSSIRRRRAGLLVDAGVDLDRLARRCRTVGVEVVVDGQVVRARTLPPGASSVPPPAKSGATPRVGSSRAGQGQGLDRQRDRRDGCRPSASPSRGGSARVATVLCPRSGARADRSSAQASTLSGSCSRRSRPLAGTPPPAADARCTGSPWCSRTRRRRGSRPHSGGSRGSRCSPKSSLLSQTGPTTRQSTFSRRAARRTAARCDGAPGRAPGAEGRSSPHRS